MKPFERIFKIRAFEQISESFYRASMEKPDFQRFHDFLIGRHDNAVKLVLYEPFDNEFGKRPLGREYTAANVDNIAIEQTVLWIVTFRFRAECVWQFDKGNLMFPCDYPVLRLDLKMWG